MPAFQCANWCFTINNPLVEEEDDDPSTWPFVAYLIYQLEEGDSGTVHWQGYLRLQTKKTLAYMKTLNSRAHWEVRQGTHEQARAYCMKEEGRLDGPYEIGDPMLKQGKRSDWSAILDLVKVKASDSDIMEQFPGQFARNYRGIAKMRTVLLPKRDWPMEVIVYWGPPGVGKSRRVQEEVGRAAYWKDAGNKWFDDYVGEENVVLDDFKGSWFCFSVLLRLLDRYPTKVESKGGSMEFCARRIYITAQRHPREWYPGQGDWEQQALLRRLTRVEMMGPEEPGALDGPPLEVGFASSLPDF